MAPAIWIAAALAIVSTNSAAAQPSAAAPSPPSVATDPLTIPCDGLAPSAVRTVPPPLDRYVTLVCTHGGQALKPVGNSSWVFDQGPMWLGASNPRGPSKDDHYTDLAYKPLTPAERAALRAELAKLHPDPAVLTRDILRFTVATSWGGHKEIYLLPPPEGAGANEQVLGMECIQSCRPIDKDPWFFTIMPGS